MTTWDALALAAVEIFIVLCIFGTICFLRDACKKLRTVWKEYRRLHG